MAPMVRSGRASSPTLRPAVLNDWESIIEHHPGEAIHALEPRASLATPEVGLRASQNFPEGDTTAESLPLPPLPLSTR